ncbi:trypsin-like serine peptidase [Niabella hirudinis]|uniref:trypsin-like serine peptidase n=1 Tax=Niabella hirudinis TaxID=1285929 RepID=UPI003EB6B39B
MRAEILFTGTLLLFAATVSGQKCVCMPDALKDKRINIIGEDLKKRPNNAICKIQVSRWYNLGICKGVGTASFINDSVLITANHCLLKSLFIYRIVFLGRGKADSSFSRKDFRIYHYPRSLFAKKYKDIAILVLTKQGKDKIRGLEHSAFEISDFKTLIGRDVDVHVTGFPCDVPETLVDKTCSARSLIFNDEKGGGGRIDKTAVAYPKLCTVSGDSGAPLWYEADGVFKVVAIHHGRDTRRGNWGVRISDDVVAWIGNKISKK